MSQKKQIFKLCILKKLLVDDNSCVILVPSTRILALPPFFLNDMKSGVLYLLNSMLKKYDRTLGGIVIGYQNVKVLLDENTGIIQIGTAETEVNISVEFYIFQPKIGSRLEGIINKKSNNHLGCLVHRYFNATILKPEDVDFEDWKCKNFNVDDKVIFIVKDLDFTSLLPYIEGIVDEENLLEKIKYIKDKSDKSFLNNMPNCDESKINVGKDVSKAYDYIDNGFSKCRTKEDQEENISEIIEDVNNTIEKDNLKKKKKKGRVSNFEGDENEKDKGSSDENIGMSYTIFKESIEIKSSSKKKKRKKAKDNLELLQESVGEKLCTMTSDSLQLTLDKSFDVQDDNAEPIKNKKAKKKKKRKNEDTFNTEKKDKTYFNTLSEPESASFFSCDPVDKLAETSISEQNIIKNAESSIDLTREKIDKENKTKKHKRRKGEKDEGLEGPSAVKINKLSPSIALKNKSTKIEMSENKDDTEEQKWLKDFCKQQLNLSKEKEKEELHDKPPKLKNENGESSAKGEEQKSDKEIKTYNLDINGKETLNVSDREMTKKKKSGKTVLREKKTVETESYDTLYEKLLKQARISINLEKPELSTSLPLPESKNRKRKRNSSLSESGNSPSLKNTGKKSKHLERKMKGCQPTFDSYRNGSMYDIGDTVEKVNPDKSLFTDSEQSHASPVKVKKSVNGELTESVETQLLREVCVKELTPSKKNKLEKDSSKNSQKKEKKSASKRRLSTLNDQSSTLYEKLMKEARRSCDIEGQSTPKKKKEGKLTTNDVEKKQRTMHEFLSSLNSEECI